MTLSFTGMCILFIPANLLFKVNSAMKDVKYPD